MNRDEVVGKWEPLPPRERDAWIGEKVMGILEYNQDRTKAGVKGFLAMSTFENGVQEMFKRYEDGSHRWEYGERKRWFTQALPHYSTDMADALQVELQMPRLGKREEYIRELVRLRYGYPAESLKVDEDLWRLVGESPDRRCLAALIAVEAC